jgi:Ser/Thr protein kinase RdoA (MazF antagonist)
MPAPLGRIDYAGDIESLIGIVSESYGLGHVNTWQIIEVGYEDCNIKIDTESGRFLIKLFAKTRPATDVGRYIDILRLIAGTNIRHPELLATKKGNYSVHIDRVSGVVMRYIDGKTFMDLGRSPSQIELHQIVTQAVQINTLDYKPPYVYDSWAIPNIDDLYRRVQEHLSPSDVELVEPVLQAYTSAPAEELPHCFVHGDIIKSNVLKSNDGHIYILDFSVANWYPRIQELAVMSTSLFYKPDGTLTLAETCQMVADEYSKHQLLTDTERKHLPTLALTAAAAELLGAVQEIHIHDNSTQETASWYELGRRTLLQLG